MVISLVAVVILVAIALMALGIILEGSGRTTRGLIAGLSGMFLLVVTFGAALQWGIIQ